MLGLKELNLKQAAEERITKFTRERYKEWMLPEFGISVDWDSFKGFAGHADSHAFNGPGIVGSMVDAVADAIEGIYQKYKKLGPAGVTIIQQKITGMEVKTDEVKVLTVGVEGTKVVVKVPNAKGGSWSKGSQEVAAWKKTVGDWIEA